MTPSAGGRVTVVKTFRYRVRDKHAAQLARMARAVSVVWNWANETQETALARGNRWPSHFDLTKLAVGASVDLGLTAMTIEAVCKRYVASRKTSGRRKLRYRGVGNLAWVPLRSKGTHLRANGFHYAGRVFSLWQHRPLPEVATLLDGSSFSTDARGRWYLNLAVEIPRQARATRGEAIGIDLGLKSMVTTSTGESIAAPQHYRTSVKRLAMAHRANKLRLSRKINAKIANQRRDFLHNLSTRLVREHRAIYVGNVSSSKMAKTSFAKSVLDAGWSSFRGFLAYKSDCASVEYREVNERGSTQTCSDCGLVGGPQGRKGLVVREWTCVGCGSVHDRDVNAALNILRWADPSPTGAPAYWQGRSDFREVRQSGCALKETRER